jgi:hypothetical protein
LTNTLDNFEKVIRVPREYFPLETLNLIKGDKKQEFSLIYQQKTLLKISKNPSIFLNIFRQNRQGSCQSGSETQVALSSFANPRNQIKKTTCWVVFFIF